ncbi:MAG: tRNA lysidine(34) synthetase TilS [Firmicutes bacterium]|nr:tRNA lysidine(34) synthetase TilS [Bacillota bacterium]
MNWIKENLNENIVATVSSCSQIIREENDYLDTLAKKEFENALVSGEEVLLDTEKLKRLDKVILRRVLRLACLSCSDTLHDVAMKHIEALTELLYKETGKNISLPNDITAENRYGKLYLYNKKKNICEDYSYTVKIGEEIYIKEIGKYVSLSKKIIKNGEKRKNVYTIAISCDKINKDFNNEITVRSKKSGDKIYLKGVGNKKLKDLFIDMKIPKNTRNSVPVAVFGDEIAAVIGYRISDKYKSEKNKENNLYIQIWEEDI